MKVKYKTIDIRTLKGLKKAEWYKKRNWIIYATDFDTVFFYKKEDK